MKRRGISLMELMIVMSAASAILTISAVILHRMMRVQEQTRHFFENERAAERLARQFRRDVHMSDDIEIETESPEIEARDGDGALIVLIKVNDRAIAYVRTLTGVVRTEHRSKGPVAREIFALAKFADLTINEESSPPRLTLTVASDPADFLPRLGEQAPTIHEAPVNIQVVAIVGRDAHFRNSESAASPNVDASEEADP